LPLHHGQRYKENKFVIAVALVFACAIACCQCLKGGKHASAVVSQLLMRWMMLSHVLLPLCMLSCVQLSFATAADILIARMLSVLCLDLSYAAPASTIVAVSAVVIACGVALGYTAVEAVAVVCAAAY